MIKMYQNDRTRWFIGLTLILLIYTLFYLYFFEADQTKYIPRRIRHLIKFGTTFAVYFIGTLHLGKLKDQWMSTIWHFTHISLLGLLTLIGAYDWIFGMVSQNVKEFTTTIQEFLISPVLYVGMGIFNKRLKE